MKCIRCGTELGDKDWWLGDWYCPHCRLVGSKSWETDGA